MANYLRKSKLTGDVVAVMDVSQPTLGVRTRAKTLALQKLQASRTTDTPPPEQQRESSYLQLRSRKLEKPPLQQSSCYRQQNPNPRLVTSNLVIRSGGSGSVGSGSSYANVIAEEEIEANCDFGSEETSFGENNVDFDGRERGARESTPCSFIRDSNDSITPGSSTRPTDRHASNRIMQRIMPSAQEIEGFFALHAQEQQRLFSEKYNFDIVNEKPLKGRYEWVRMQP
ncbi:hypothetical protein L1987_59714 [Smallanthus sonchifolius]|uniref:Uncharacterized protein n=1 Tax=Smallanthus sonchifolius TaxID=185202 RepID=A0ACB9D682_9ASTR|nr:hypothetical protein L1987_59714 [Smallanthus sonchifolius]